MFTELMPLLRKRGLLLTISLVEGDTLRATVLPQKASEADDKATTTPLAITGTAEELDRDLPQQLIEFVGAHLQLQSTLASAKADMDAAAKAAREEARKKTTKPATPTKTSVPDAPAKPESESEPSLFAQPDQTHAEPVPGRRCGMKIQVVEREFVYHGAVLADPNPKFSIEEVRSFYATQFPELTNAAITGPENVGERLRYNFERAIGSKG